MRGEGVKGDAAAVANGLRQSELARPVSDPNVRTIRIDTQNGGTQVPNINTKER